jgi:hypothetical protein
MLLKYEINRQYNRTRWSTVKLPIFRALYVMMMCRLKFTPGTGPLTMYGMYHEIRIRRWFEENEDCSERKYLGKYISRFERGIQSIGASHSLTVVSAFFQGSCRFMEATRYRRIEKLGQGTYGVVYKALVESGTNKGGSPSFGHPTCCVQGFCGQTCVRPMYFYSHSPPSYPTVTPSLCRKFCGTKKSSA